MNKFKKLTLGTLSGVAIITPIIAAVSCGENEWDTKVEKLKYIAVQEYDSSSSNSESVVFTKSTMIINLERYMGWSLHSRFINMSTDKTGKARASQRFLILKESPTSTITFLISEKNYNYLALILQHLENK